VKAVEYFLRVRLDGLDDSGTIADSEALYPWIHFGLTSEDVNNLAQRLLVKQAVSEAIVPAIREVRDALVDLAQEHRGTPMLAHTHGQPATPTTFGKEMAVYASRLGRALGRVVVANGDLSGNSPAPRAPTPPTTRPTPMSTGGRSPSRSCAGLIWNTRRSRRR